MNHLSFKVNEEMISLTEKRNGQDCEFLIHTKTNEALDRLRKLRAFFEDDKVYTDILFYSRQDHEYQVIVRRDVYVPFVVHLFQLQLLLSVAWQGH
ncbi:hypothetical protein [Sporolactobacillus vineae]|jgi:hypothetical protein|uniref:hypothetical protein n=1 Tax=Sporolactobacillus vineae TaxID=444463 RepID=UPI000288024E|nr:hypothetical protein [Sporolactobacillus vineae]